MDAAPRKDYVRLYNHLRKNHVHVCRLMEYAALVMNLSYKQVYQTGYNYPYAYLETISKALYRTAEAMKAPQNMSLEDAYLYVAEVYLAPCLSTMLDVLPTGAELIAQ